MADAPGHLLGQMIGSYLEAAAEPELRALVNRHAMHLDVKGDRPGIRQGTLLSLKDAKGNNHNLDFVIERSEAKVGEDPVYAAFVECAWRRYGKHSKAKAQELQGAVLPLVAKHRTVAPVPAAIVAGEWTRPAIKQLETSGFVVLQMNFAKLASAFAKHGVDIFGRDKVPDLFWAKQVATLQAMNEAAKLDLVKTIRETHEDDFTSFIEDLEARIVRSVDEVAIEFLHGRSVAYPSLADAIEGVRKYSDDQPAMPFIRFIFKVKFTNGDAVNGSYAAKADAIAFLQKLM